MKIYIVTQGECSDYHICAIFENEDKAQRFTEKINCNARVETWNTESELISLIENGFELYTVIMNEIGNTFNISHYIPNYLNNLKSYENPVFRYERTGEFKAGFVGHPFKISIKIFDNKYRFTLVAKSEEQAIKSANEKRIQMIAEDKWIPEENK
jgi:hypothetical protein